MTDTRILQREEDTKPYRDTIIEVTNGNAKALGFLPFAAYDAAFLGERVWVAVGPAGEFPGHLLFGGVHPTLKINQLYVAPDFRRRGIARQLIDALVPHAQQRGYGSIRARVAEDLEANAAWDRLGFPVEQTKPGGETTGRMLSVRFRRLQPEGAQTHFLGLCDRPERQVDAIKALGLPVNRADCYTLDLNVWLDFARQRAPFFEAARELVRQASRGRYRLWFTGEFQREALRTRQGQGDDDPLLRAAVEWSSLAPDDPDEVAALAARLRADVFPDRSLTRRGAENDTSDLVHLALSIRGGARGFVTRERALLRARDIVFDKYQFQILAPSDILDERDSLFEPPLGLGRGLRLRPVLTERSAVASFIDGAVGQGSHRLEPPDVDSAGRACFLGDRLVGVVHWRAVGQGEPAVDLVIADADVVDDEARQRVFDVLTGSAVFDLRPTGRLTRVVLQTDLETHARFSDDLERFGFFPTGEAGRYVRFLLGPATGVPDWSTIAAPIERELDARSQWLGDAEDRPVLRLQFTDGRAELTRFEFETRFGLMAASLRERSAWYIPIKPGFRDELLPLARQTTLLRAHDAAFRIERVYFRRPKRCRLARGDIVLFYVSQPTSAAIGFARCTASLILDVAHARQQFGRQAVIAPEDAADKGRVHCIAFDNYTPFQRRLTAAVLRRLGFYPSQGPVSVVALPEPARLLELLSAGLDEAPRPS